MDENIQKDFLRQMEILAYSLNKESFSKADFAYKFNVAEITINRDLASLRKMGIQIFSKNGAINLYDTPDSSLLIKLTAEYLNFTSQTLELETKVSSLRKNAEESFMNKLVLISKAIKENIILSITYSSFASDLPKTYKIKPINLFSNELNWILNAYDYSSDSPKTFYLSRIKYLKLSHESFNKIVIDDTAKTYKIKLRFNPKVKNQIYDKIWFTEFEINEDADEYVILTTQQPISNKLSSWCISWWNMIEIIEPLELKIEINEMIEAFKNNNPS